MLENIADASDADVSVSEVNDVSQTQVDKFFESGGQDVPTNSVANDDTVEPTEPAQQPEKKERFVPYDALHEERERRKEYQREVQELRNSNTKMEQTWQQMVQRANQPAPQAAPVYEEDPLGALKHQTDQITEALVNQHRYLTTQEQAVKQQQIQQQRLSEFSAQCTRSVEEFKGNTPDYLEAYKHLQNVRFEEFQTAGYSAEQAKQLILEDEMAIASKAFQDGVNPAERIYKLASMRGYSKAQASTDVSKAEQRMSQLEKGMKQASKSLSNVGGKSMNDDISLEALSQMDSSELEGFLNDKNWTKVVKQFKR